MLIGDLARIWVAVAHNLRAFVDSDCGRHCLPGPSKTALDTAIVSAWADMQPAFTESDPLLVTTAVVVQK